MIWPFPIGQTDTEARAKATVVPTVSLDHVEAREALKRLFRENQFGVTISPDVTGTLTLDVQRFDFLSIVRILTRELDATYRIEHGWFEIFPKPDVAFGKLLKESHPYGEELERVLPPRFTRSSHREVVQIVRWSSRPSPSAELIWRVHPHHARPYYVRAHVQRTDGGWKVLDEAKVEGLDPMKFERAPVSEVLASLAERAEFEWALESQAEGLISVDLTGLGFSAAFAKILKAADATYEVGDSFVHVVPHAHVPWDRSVEILGSVRFENVPIRDALPQILGRVGLPFTINDDVQGRVSADWRRIRVEEALQRVLAQVGAIYRSGGGVLEIAKREG